MGVQNDAISYLDGDTDERDRLCRFHRHRDLLVIRQKFERQELVGTRISTGDPSRNSESEPGIDAGIVAIRHLVIGSGHATAVDPSNGCLGGRQVGPPGFGDEPAPIGNGPRQHLGESTGTFGQDQFFQEPFSSTHAGAFGGATLGVLAGFSCGKVPIDVGRRNEAGHGHHEEYRQTCGQFGSRHRRRQ